MEKMTITTDGKEFDLDCGDVSPAKALTYLGTAIRVIIIEIAKDSVNALSILALVANTIEKDIKENME